MIDDQTLVEGAYAVELDAAAAILQRVHPIGQVKAIGRLEVAAALAELFPADDGEPVTEEWLRAVGFADDIDDIGGADCLSRGNLKWFQGKWTYGCELIPDQPARGHVRRLCAALGISLTE